MKTLIYANTDGNFDLLHNIYDMCKGVSTALCAGNFPLVSKSTPIELFYKNEFMQEGQNTQQFLSEPRTLPTYTYAIYGEYDDPFVPDKEQLIPNLVRINHYWILESQAYTTTPVHNVNIPASKRIRIGFLGGYYSHSLWQDINPHRAQQERSRKSLALCSSDLNSFYGKKLDYLITFEAPNQYDGCIKFKGGSEKISDLIRDTKPIIHLHAHMRDPSVGYIGDTLSIGIPPIKEGFYVLDLYSGKIDMFRYGVNQSIATYENTKRSV